ncbi:hypothetical protein [Duganella sp. HH101]|uniref:hypothetical protein n=1 Tax=Duganella sp. HH101 TaxID=1781066 RepID=UPI000873C5DE|nr:hypothetical protein [Duganella sp. HH101]
MEKTVGRADGYIRRMPDAAIAALKCLAPDAVVSSAVAAGTGVRAGAAGQCHAFAGFPLWIGFDYDFFLGQLECEQLCLILLFHY